MRGVLVSVQEKLPDVTSDVESEEEEVATLRRTDLGETDRETDGEKEGDIEREETEAGTEGSRVDVPSNVNETNASAEVSERVDGNEEEGEKEDEQKKAIRAAANVT